MSWNCQAKNETSLPGLFMARSYVRQNVVNRFELQPRSDERSYDSLFTQIAT